MEEARKAGQIPSSQWDCLWMLTQSPLAFDVFPGNQNEQTTLKPLETKVIRDFACSEFIFCSDARLGSKSNRRFNSFGNRSYVITQSLKKKRSLSPIPPNIRHTRKESAGSK